MSDAIVYVDTSDVREGPLDELQDAIKELVDFVEANEPHLGKPTEKLLKQSHEKARLLGRGAVTTDALHAGFTRFGVR